MADKYCDHGLYGLNAEFVGSIAGSTLTVSSITSGKVGIGATVFGTGVNEYSLIIAAGTGVGGTGTYTLSRSSTVSAGSTMTSVGGTYAAAWDPDWGVAHDGDGEAIGTATPATVSIDLSAATAAAGATISIMGAVFTCVASGANNNQFNAGSGATLVSNIVTAINRTTNTNTISEMGTGWNASRKSQDAFFARIGTPNTTLEIMTRVGSAVYNSGQAVTSGFTGGTFGPYTFTGGSSGAWGWFQAHYTMWRSGIAVNTYGLFVASPAAGALLDGDICYVRTKRGSEDITIRSLQSTASQQLNPPSRGTATTNTPFTFIFDNGNKWVETNGRLRFQYAALPAGYTSAGIGSHQTSGYTIFSGEVLPDGHPNFIIEQRNPYLGSYVTFQGLFLGGFCFEGTGFSYGRYDTNDSAELITAGSNTYPIGRTTSSISSSSPLVCKKSSFYMNGNAATNFLVTGAYYSSSTILAQYLFEDCTIAYNYASSPKNIVSSTDSNGADWNITFKSCRFLGLPAGSRTLNITVPHNTGVLAFEDCDLTNVENAVGTHVSGEYSLASRSSDAKGGVFISSAKPSQVMVSETVFGASYWIPGAGQPTLNAVAPDGIAISQGIIVPPYPVMCSSKSPYYGSPFRLLFTGAENQVWTLTANWLADKAKTLNTEEVGILVTYIDATTGLHKTITSIARYKKGVTITPVSDAVSPWTPSKNDGLGNILPFANINGADRFYYRYQSSVTTTTFIKTNTMLVITPVICRPADGANERYFFCPDIQLT